MIFEFPKALNLKIQVFWNITLLLFGNSNRRFGEACRFLLQGLSTSSVLQYSVFHKYTGPPYSLFYAHRKRKGYVNTTFCVTKHFNSKDLKTRVDLQITDYNGFGNILEHF
jgi:hypothetical protein